MNTSILDAVRHPAVPPRGTRGPASLEGGDHDFLPDEVLLPLPPRLVTEAVVVGCAMAASTVAGFVLGLLHEGCVIGVCG